MLISAKHITKALIKGVEPNRNDLILQTIYNNS